jgi:tetratricopeptide (TPR) repeat protein
MDKLAATRARFATLNALEGSDWHGYAGELSALQAFDEATHAYEQAIHLAPTNSLSFINLGIVNLNLALTRRDAGLAEKADKSIRNAIAIDEVDGNPHYYMGLLQEATSRKEEAISSWYRALALNPAASGAQAKLNAHATGS